VLALIYLQAWSMLLCTHIYINDAAGLCTAYGVKCCIWSHGFMPTKLFSLFLLFLPVQQLVLGDTVLI